jgi:DNA-binding SARP family transcriptional activator
VSLANSKPTTTSALQLLGAFRLLCDGREVPLSLREQRLVALLALRAGRPRNYLAATLWPNGSDERALTSLRVTVWRLRQTVPDLVVAGRNTLALRSDVSCDVQEVLQVASRVAREPETLDLWEAVSALSGDDFLPGWYDDWVQLERERLRQVRVRTLDRLARLALIDSDDPDIAATAALASARIEPLRETPQRLLIAAEIASGNLAEARGHFESYRHRVLDELGIEPSPRLSELVGRLVRSARR